MSTRSLVGVMVGNICRAVYVHSDGYLDGVGQEVLEYKTQSEVEELIKPGDRSYLDGGFYADNGETNVAPTEYDSFEEFFEGADACWAEYYYVFKGGVWYFGDTYEGSKYFKKLSPVKEALESMEKNSELEENN
jgi:hypothetical protein